MDFYYTYSIIREDPRRVSVVKLSSFFFISLWLLSLYAWICFLRKNKECTQYNNFIWNTAEKLQSLFKFQWNVNQSIIQSLSVYCFVLFTLKEPFFWNSYFSMKKCFISQKYFNYICSNTYLKPIWLLHIISTEWFLILSQENAFVKLWLSLRISCSLLYR